MTNTLDPRIVTALKALAYGYLTYDEGGSRECLYCALSFTLEARDMYQHEPTCPILVARAVLREMGIPLCTYRVTWQHQLAGKWGEYQTEVDAYSKPEAISKMRDGRSYVKEMRNITAVLVREVMP